MAEVIKMPQLSDTMTDGVVAEWHKKVGDSVTAGELLAEIETDKATMEFESFYDGVLLYIGIQKGESAPVNDVLAIIGEKGEDINALIEEAKVSSSPQETKVAIPVIKEITDTPKPVLNKEVEIQKPSNPINTTVIQSTGANGSTKASPLAKRLAEEKGINISKIQGSGDGGRIIKRDIDNYNGGSSFVAIESYNEVAISQMRKTIARRLGESKFSAPHFYLTVSIDMDNAIATREAINQSIAPNKISFNDLVIKSSAAALKKHPNVNSSWLEDRIRYNQHVHIGVAVAVEDGLLVPVVRFADGKTLSEISAEVRDLAAKAKNKKLQPQDWEGNTFTISNLGMFGIDEFTAIINPPDACIMAIGGIQQVPVVKNGQVVPGNIMKVTLSCDHRVVDGAVGSAFLNTFKNYMENPVLCLGSMSI